MTNDRPSAEESACAALRRSATREGFAALNRVVKPVVKAGLFSPLPIGAGLVVLETTGRKTGRKREVPLVAVRFGDRVNVSTVRSRSLWAKNIEADENVSVWVGGRKREATGVVDEGPLTVAELSLR